jgi:type IV pilus assembly protein PilB
MVRALHKIKDLLLEAGLVSADEWANARGQGKNVVETLLSQEIIEEEMLLEVLGRATGVPPVDLTNAAPDAGAIECVPQDSAKEWGILPLSKNGNVLTIATSDPFDVLLLDDIKRMTRCHVRTVYAHGAMIQRAIEQVYQTGKKQVDDLLDEVAADDGQLAIKEEATEDIETATVGDDAPAVKMINLILLRALKDKASDIHIEPCEKNIRVRFRVDGRMKIVMTPPKALINALISRIKILSQLDIAERHAPQDGKFQLRYEGRSIDFRVSILPVVGGEKAVMRILDTGTMALKLGSMGYEDRCLLDIRKAIHSAYGMVLVTGPTGSGKSTTLYSCVQEISSPEVNVVTVEDPVEYRMDGINQVPVNPKRGMTFAGALRSILRQDPDTVLVGEIRDKETADIAI